MGRLTHSHTAKDLDKRQQARPHRGEHAYKGHTEGYSRVEQASRYSEEDPRRDSERETESQGDVQSVQ